MYRLLSSSCRGKIADVCKVFEISRLKILALSIFSILYGGTVTAQPVSHTMIAPDTSLTMNIWRVKGRVFIEFTFPDSFNFRFIELQRRPASESNFVRFGYITFNEVTTHCGHLIKEDYYPYHGSLDVFYRVKMVFENGKERIYPYVLLSPDIGGG